MSMCHHACAVCRKVVAESCQALNPELARNWLTACQSRFSNTAFSVLFSDRAIQIMVQASSPALLSQAGALGGYCPFGGRWQTRFLSGCYLASGAHARSRVDVEDSIRQSSLVTSRLPPCKRNANLTLPPRFSRARFWSASCFWC